ncbi:MAG: hypothetical protein N2321_02240 [Melioribacteraceae bacterium]|nr:hypothetical protein [Melioribacteraceae bacterium]
MKNKVILFQIFFLSVIIFQFCQINEPQMPIWNVSLNIPITKKSYSLNDILEKSKELKFYTDATNKNIIYYSKTTNLDNIKIDDKLKVDGISESASETIGLISLKPDSVKADIGYSWLGINVNPNTQAIIPPVSNVPVSSNTDASESFSSAKIDNGLVDLEIFNQFPSPVSLTINNIALKNIGTGEIVFSYNNNLVVSPKSTGKISSIPLTKGLIVKNQFVFECVVSTNGSNGNLITLPQNSFTVKAKIKQLNVSETQAKIPEQNPIVIDKSFSFEASSSQPTKFNSIKIESGLMNFRIVNNLDLDATMTITINNLKNPNGQTFSQTKFIGRKQTVSVFSNYSLKDHSLVSLTGTPTNQVSYKVNFSLLSSTDLRTLKSSDGISGIIDIGELKLKEFSGQLQPKTVTSNRSAISFDLKDLKTKFQFQQINFKNPIAQIRLKSTAQFEFKLDGKIEGKNSLGQKAILGLNNKTLTNQIISPTDSVLTINPDSLSLFFKKFSRFPDSLIVYSGGIVNPNYKVVNIKSTDQITGSSIIELPFDIGLQNAELKDSVEVDLSSDDRDKLKNVNSLEAGIKITNGLPVSISFTGKMYDAQNKFLTYFPPKYSDQDTVLTINGAITDANGNVSNKNEQTVKIKTKKEEIDKIRAAVYMRVNLKINTSASNNSPVKLKTTDEVLINAFGSTNYKVKQ